MTRKLIFAIEKLTSLINTFIMNRLSTLRSILMAGMMLVGLSCFADDTCDYFIEMHKRDYAPAPGWEGARIDFINGNGDVVNSCALADGEFDGEAILTLPKEELTCRWVEGADDIFCFFLLYDPNGFLVYEGYGGVISFSGELDFLVFTPECNTATPSVPTNFSATGAVDVLQSTLVWTNPSTTVGGEATELTSITIWRDGNEVAVLEDGLEPGAEMTWVDEVPCAGIYEYHVFASNDAGIGGAAHDIDSVGYFYEFPTEGQATIMPAFGYIYTQDYQDGLYGPNWHGFLTIDVPEAGQYVKLVGSHFINDTDVLRVYDGTSTEGEILAEYTGSCFDRGAVLVRGDIDVVSKSGALTLEFITGDQLCRGFTFYTEIIEYEGIGEAQNGVRVFPNPANDEIQIEGINVAKVTIYNALGQYVTTQTASTLSCSNLNDGLYMLQIESQNGQVVTRRMMIAH